MTSLAQKIYRIILCMGFSANLENTASYFPDHCGVMDGGRRITFRQFNTESSQIAAALVAAGVQPGDHAALCAPNSYEWLAFYFGVLKAGAVAVTFSHMLTAAELPQILSDCQPKVLFTVDEKLDAFGSLKSRRPCPGRVISDGGDISFPNFIAKGRSGFNTIDRDRNDTAAILYTGGTTGTPKGAMLSHQNIQTSSMVIACKIQALYSTFFLDFASTIIILSYTTQKTIQNSP